MKNIEKLRDRLNSLISQTAELKADIEQLEKEAMEEKPVPPHPRWKPDVEQHYYINHNGFPDSGFTCLEHKYQIGNAFATKTEVEFMIGRLEVLAEMREWAGRWNDPFVIMLNTDNDKLSAMMTYGPNSTYGEIRFATKEDAENCIKAVGVNRIKKYYFCVPDTGDNE